MKFFKGCLVGIPLSFIIWVALAALWIKGFGFDWQSGLVAMFILMLVTALLLGRPHQPEQVSPRTMQRIERVK